MSGDTVFLPKSLRNTKTSQPFQGKLANVISVQPHRFDPETYKPEEPILYEDDKGRKEVKAVEYENYMRWRYGPDGQVQSNAKLVQWEDGSYSLFLGKEAFEVSVGPNRNMDSYMLFRDQYVFQQHVPQKMMFKPFSIKKRMRIQKLESSLNPTKTTKLVVSSINPEKDKKKREMQIQESIRAKEREASKRTDEITASWIEESDEDEAHKRQKIEAEEQSEISCDDESSEES